MIHSALHSSFYELVKVFEVDLMLGDESWPMRFELFRNMRTKGHFRCRILQGEHYRLPPTFPQKRSKPVDQADVLVFTDWSGGPRIGRYDDFAAPSAVKAIGMVLKDFAAFLEHTTGEKARF